MGGETIGRRFKSCVKEFGDIPIIKYFRDGAWRDMSWFDFDRKVQQLGSAMLSLGIEPGDRIAIYSKNCPEWQWTDMAIQVIGAVNVALYPTLTTPQAEYILSDSGSRIVFVGEREQLNRILEVYEYLPGLFKIVTMADLGCDHPDVITFGQMLELGRDEMDPDLMRSCLDACQPDDLSTIIYTSGTTGNPKGVMLTHDNVISNVLAAGSLGEVNVGDVTLSVLPLSHSLERTAGYYLPMFKGVTIAHARGIEELIEDLPAIKPDFMVCVPRLYEKVYAKVLSGLEKESRFKQNMFRRALKTGKKVSELISAGKPVPLLLSLQNKIDKKLVFSKVYKRIGRVPRFFISGGAPLSKEIAEFFHAMDILILEGYGLTETAPILTVNRDVKFKFGTVGYALPGVELKIAGDGEVLARGPNIMKGYFNQPEATAEVIDAEGWFHTGDIGDLDAEGFLTITDRKKDIIVTAGGKNIAPQNLENTLNVDRYIEQCCVIGDKRKFVCALVVPDFEELNEWAKAQDITVADREALVKNEAVIDFYTRRIEKLQEDFARFEKIKKFKLLPELLTEEAGFVTPSLKIKRKEIEAAFKADIDSMYGEEKEAEPVIG